MFQPGANGGGTSGGGARGGGGEGGGGAGGGPGGTKMVPRCDLRHVRMVNVPILFELQLPVHVTRKRHVVLAP